MALTGLEFVDPHLGAGPAYLAIPAPAPRPHHVALRSLPDFSEFHEQTSTTSLLVLVDGVVVHEWYRDGLGAGTLFLGASATRSLLAHLVGVAVRSGALDVDAAVEKYVPELADTGYRGVPVHDLLTMTSGVDWVEDHRDPDGPATALVSSFGNGGSSRALFAGVGPRYPPGTRYEYCTADSQVLDWVRERANGVPFRSALTGLWRDLGGATDAVIGVDGDGVALAGGGVAATAGDWARVGLLQVDGTSPGGERLLDRDWVDEASRPSLPFLRPGRLPGTLSAHVGFGRHWWPLDDAGHRVSADGSRGPRSQLSHARRHRGCGPSGRGPMNRKVIITCALTGAGATVGKSEHVPVTPQQIAESGIEAARAGAAIVHVHVRDPRSGDGSREVALYREVVERLRDSGVDVVINTTAGMGGDLYLNPDDPSGFAEGTDLVSGLDRLAHVEELLPDICTLDCGSLNFGEGSLVYVSTPDMLRAGAKRIQELGVRPELEIFDTGHLWFANKLVEEGLIDGPAMYQLCMGIPYGAPPEPALLAAMAAQIPAGVVWASFAIGRMQMPWVAQSVLLGGHVRVGLEDNLYLGRGNKVTNAQLVVNAVTLLTAMGADVATPDEAREILSLRPRR